MFKRGRGFLPVSGIRRNRGSLRLHPGAGANDMHGWRCARRQRKRMRYGGRQCAEQRNQHGQPHHQRAAQQDEVRLQQHWKLTKLLALSSIPIGQCEGAAVPTATLSSTLLSTPLASLNTSVKGMVLSLGSAAFKSINMTW